MIKISHVICVWNTSHLLKRSIQNYCKQDFPKDEWELIVIDDNSFDDVKEAISFAEGKINMRYVRLEHDFGMRGNTVAFNTGFEMAQGEIISESTPETIPSFDMIRILYEPHTKNDRCFVAMKTYNLTYELQLQIDTVDWQSDINNVKKLWGFDNPWTLNNVKTTHFGTHQTCSIRKKVWLEMTKGRGFPLFGDYGSDDAWYAGTRPKYKIEDITIMEPMIIHQWHLPFNYFVSMGYAPMLNRWNHSTSNYLNDTSGEVPKIGTAGIWDGDKRDRFERMDNEEKKSWESHDEQFLKTGGDPKVLKQRIYN